MSENQTEYELKPVKSTPAEKPDDSFLAVVERLSARPDIPVEKIKQIMEMQEHILDRNAKQAFNSAMMRTQSKIELVVAKEKNVQTGSKYADLKSVLIKSKPIYTAEGFSLMFYPLESTREGHQRVGVDIMHEQGHTEQRYGDFAIQTTGIAGKVMMTQIHGEGSAFSYGRRYLTCMIFNIPTGDDDDGNTAGGIEFITEAQVTEITKLISSTKTNVEAFLKYAGAESVETIPAKSYSKVLIALKQKAKTKKSEREPGEEG